MSQLSVRPTDRILEVGCGPGHAVRLLCPHLSRGTIIGIDRSAIQVRRARSNVEPFLADGRASIRQLALSDAPTALGERGFTTTFAVNVNVFWTAPAMSFDRLSRLLRRGGRAYLFYETPSAAGIRRLETLMPDLLAEHGFVVDDVRAEDVGRTRVLGVTASSGGARAVAGTVPDSH